MPRQSADADMSAQGKLEAKLAKHMSQETVDTILESGEEELKKKLVNLAQYENETETAQQNDEELERLAEALSTAKAPYKDTLKGIKIQRNLIALRLDDLGKSA